MRRAFFRNLLMDIKKTLSRFISIVIIIALGVAFYAGVRATSPDMKMSGDAYFDKNNLMDFKLISTLGLTRDDLSVIRKQKGITDAEGSYSLDAVIEKDKHSLVININSLPDENGINSIRIVRGRKPVNDDEAVVEERFFREYKLKLGDILTLQSGSEKAIDDSLKVNSFKIVGTSYSPLYVSAQRQLSPVGSGTVRGFLYILPGVFKGEAYTEIYVRAEGMESKNSLLDNESYKNTMKDIENNLKNLGPERCEIRYAEVVKTTADKLNEAEARLEDSKKETAQKFSDAYKELDIARDKIDTGYRDLQVNEVLFNRRMAEGRKQISFGRNQIQAGESELNLRAKEIEDGRQKLIDGKKVLDKSEAKLKAGKDQAAEGISNGIAQALLDAKNLAELDPLNIINIIRYNTISQVYEKDFKGKDFDSMYNSLKQDNMLDEMKPYFDIEKLKEGFDKAASDINSGRNELLSNEKSLEDGEAKLDAGRAELEANRKRIIDAEAELERGKLEGLKKLEIGRKELEDGKDEIDKNEEKLKAEEEKTKARILDAEEEIRKNMDKLNDIKKPEWYVLGRSYNVGYETYKQDSDRIDSIGRVFPLVFFLVASLVSLTTMTRMVQEKRMEIGTLSALGYSRKAIVSHYLIYSLSASIIGSAVGVSAGFRLFPPLIMNAYSSLYSIPETVTPFNISLGLMASLIAILFITFTTVAAALGELRVVPASLMRPKSPRPGKRVLLEKFTYLWRRLNFTRKVAARNIFRYKQRLLMTVIGIAACTGLMITGFGLREGVIGATEIQFNRIYRYDMTSTLTKSVSETEKDDMKGSILKVPNIKSVLFAYLKNITIKAGDSREQDAYLVVPEDSSSIGSYIDLTMGGKDLGLDGGGVILTEKLSNLINKKVGDNIEINLDNKIINAKVSSITRHYVQHYIYMSPSLYQKLTGGKPVYNGFYGLLNDTSEGSENSTSSALKSIKFINSAGFKNNIHVDYSKAVDSIDTVILVLIVSAGVLAFVVIYNLTNINISERKRELATIKLLGFYNNELALYIYRENMILTVIGSILGIFTGIVMSRLILSTAETNLMMFSREINPVYFLYSVLLTILFSVIVNLIMYKRFDNINMIESLKSPE